MTDFECDHSVTMKGLCALCGKDLDKLNIKPTTSVSMVHAVPELRVTEDYAIKQGRIDQARLIREKKLVLVVDLDQTIIHTTHDTIKNDPNVHKFCLWSGHPTYYTKLRPFLDDFLERMYKIFELHIFTFGCRRYAHKIAEIIDPEKKYFSHRILSRDESVDQMSKRANLKDLFPCGDSMVCIIDDRSDVWSYARNLIQVKPYVYFKSTGDINSPYALGKNKQTINEQPQSEKRKLPEDSTPDGSSKKQRTELDFDSLDEKRSDEDPNKDETSDENSTTSAAVNDSVSNEKPASDDDGEHRDDDDDDTDDDSLEEDADYLESLLKQDDEDTQTDEIPEDFDSHLLLLAERLEEIHGKFYEEHKERVRYLSEHEQYLLPDLKEIIPMILRHRGKVR